MFKDTARVATSRSMDNSTAGSIQKTDLANGAEPGTPMDNVEADTPQDERESHIFVYRSVEEAAGDVIVDFVPGRDKIDLSTLGTFVFSGSVPRANALWVKPAGDDLRLLGDMSGVPHRPIIQILLKETTTLAAADVGAFDVVHNQTIDATASIAAVQLHLDDWPGLSDAIGTDQADRLVGTGHDNALYGNGGDDSLYGRGWNDHLYGAEGNDLLRGGQGHDLLDGGADTDTADYSDHMIPIGLILRDERATRVYVDGQAEDTLLNIENITGGAGSDYLIGNHETNVLIGRSGNDCLYGRGGDDILSGGHGQDFIDGGAGVDTVDYSGRFGSVKIHLNGSNRVKASINGQDEDFLIHIENIFGGLMDDLLTGDHLDNVLTGGEGADTLTGAAGRDTFFYRYVEETKGDIITDFTPGEDIVDFSAFGPTMFSTQGAQAHSIWTKCTGSDLKILGDRDGNLETHEINMTLQGTSSITAENLNLETVSTADNSGSLNIAWCQLDVFAKIGHEFPLL